MGGFLQQVLPLHFPHSLLTIVHLLPAFQLLYHVLCFLQLPGQRRVLIGSQVILTTHIARGVSRSGITSYIARGVSRGGITRYIERGVSRVILFVTR